MKALPVFSGMKCIHSEIRVEFQPLQLVKQEEKAEQVVIISEKVEQQQHLQQYQLSLTLQYQLRARNANATSFLEARKGTSGLATTMILQTENKAKPTDKSFPLCDKLQNE